MLKAKELIASGVLGEVVLISEVLLGKAGLEKRQEMGSVHYPLGGPGGTDMGMVDHGVHMLDVFPWLLGSTITSIYGRGNVSGEKPASEFAIFHFENGALGHLLIDDVSFPSDLPVEGRYGYGWDAAGVFSRDHLWNMQPVNLRVHGTKGSLRIFPYGDELFLTTSKGRHLPTSSIKWKPSCKRFKPINPCL
jgi:predicted dehydrogenase